MNDLKFTTAGDYMKKNERIRELLEQVGVKYVTMPDDTVYEKFAELIVRECMEINKQELAFNAFERLMNKYKQHFGVEE